MQERYLADRPARGIRNIFSDYVRYLFTPEDSQEGAFQRIVDEQSRYAGIDKAFFWLVMSMVFAFVIATFLS